MRTLRSIPWLFLALAMLAVPCTSSAQISVGVSIRIAPPALPVYTQPVCPGDGYIWTPGYWAYGPDGYYWVPGTWVMAPAVGMLWTPGYWGWGGGVYAWHGGYWGPHIGFYGGVNYGFGYGGVGYEGGYWNHGVFAYNRSVTNVNVTVIHNTYNKTVINNTTVNRVSYSGGTGGINARPNHGEEAAAREHHVQATSEQMQHEHVASTNRAQLASANHGRPAFAATAKPGEFNGHGATAANRPAGPNNAAARGMGHNRPSGESAARSAGTAHPIAERATPTSANPPQSRSNNQGGQHPNESRPNNKRDPSKGGSERHEGEERTR
jgi:hypothetical protein